MSDSFGMVWRLAAEHLAAAFPDCRGDEIDGVDLVHVDADLHGCVSHFLGKPSGTDEWQRDVLRRVTEDLDRIVPQLEPKCSQYFRDAQELAHALLASSAPIE